MGERCLLCGVMRDKLTCFVFPKKVSLRQQWARFCGMQLEHVLQTHKLCLRHFLGTDWTVSSHGILRLKKNVIPSVMLVGKKSALQDCGGFNNKPNTFQCQSAPKRLPGCHLITASASGDVITDIPILTGSCERINTIETVCDGPINSKTVNIIPDHDYCKITKEHLTFSQHVEYITGLVLGKLKDRDTCKVCLNACFIETHPENAAKNSVSLIQTTSTSELLLPSTALYRICSRIEQIIREHPKEISKKTFFLFVSNRILSGATNMMLNSDMEKHLSGQDIFENHLTQLIKLIIHMYITIRLHHETDKLSTSTSYIRHKHNKLLFKHQ